MKLFIAKLLNIVGHYYPFYRGRWRLWKSKFCNWILEGRADVVWTSLRRCKGCLLLISLDDSNGRMLYYFGDISPEITWICQRILREGDTVLDMGANLGAVTIVSRQMVGAKGQVHAFEPQSTLVNLMRQSLEKNGYSDVNIHNIALGVQTELAELFIPIGHSGAASFFQNSISSDHRQTIPVQVENTATYLSDLDLPPIRFVKMDVEGYEAEILQSGLEFFKVNRPEVILFEQNDHSQPFSQLPVVKILSELNYQFFDIQNSLLKVRICRIDSASSSKCYGHDILAAQKGVIYNEIARLVGASI